jgi:hypothetical protein
MGAPSLSSRLRRHSLLGVVAAVLLAFGLSGTPAQAVRAYTNPVFKQPKAPLEQGKNIRLLRKPQYLQKRGKSTEITRGGVAKQFKRKGWSYGTLSRR